MNSLNNIKMVVTDLDGTLLKNDKTLSDFTMNVIDRLQEKGILFAIATARPIRSVKEFIPNLNYDIGIYHNGAIIEGLNKTFHLGINNPQKTILEILNDNQNCHIAVEVNDQLYSNFDARIIWPGIDYIFTLDFNEISHAIADKIIIRTNCNQEIKRIENILPDDLYIQLCENVVALIMNKKATKLEAIKTVASQIGITLEQIVAFGDDYNDKEMIQHCFKGIAMQNAVEEVKLIADEICGLNDNDAVALWLEKNLLSIIK